MDHKIQLGNYLQQLLLNAVQYCTKKYLLLQYREIDLWLDESRSSSSSSSDSSSSSL